MTRIGIVSGILVADFSCDEVQLLNNLFAFVTILPMESLAGDAWGRDLKEFTSCLAPAPRKLSSSCLA